MIHELYNFADWLLDDGNDSKAPTEPPDRFKGFVQEQFPKDFYGAFKLGTKRIREGEAKEGNDEGQNNNGPPVSLNKAGFELAYDVFVPRKVRSSRVL